MAFLTSKLARITVQSCPGHEQYVAASNAILGFVLSAIPSDNGARPGIFLPDDTPLYLEQMGEGVPSIAALLVELVTAKDKIFLIEEPENDLHPSALKALLEMILSGADRNQFIVTTHSNIVVQYLGSGSGSLFEVEQAESAMPTSVVTQVPDTVAARSDVLRKLGYSLSDFDLWDGWLILEESSAERIIRDFLIPYFVPRLTNLRLLSSDGVDNAEPTFAALYRMVLFTHLEEIYRHATWVRLDGDKSGLEVTERLKASFPQAREGQFGNFSQSNFESYYPEHFADRVAVVLGIPDRKEKRIQKRQLLIEVIAWLNEDERRARSALAQSAAEIIEFLAVVNASMH
ncbi:AAA family ATPase [Pseudoduganella violaceinigra]|uniref:AAA family ATPase n=1 Tax=Pseudoduganella violaceinigra TaxID=246602 RepID=UPI00048A0465|nr:AAA family ATPase [Pseudoduganella violaceinigra]